MLRRATNPRRMSKTNTPREKKPRACVCVCACVVCMQVSLVPRLISQAFVACSMKSLGDKPGNEASCNILGLGRLID